MIIFSLKCMSGLAHNQVASKLKMSWLPETLRAGCFIY
nr:MAG TPA: hypothetical protein [Caudoviricetes sp.]